MLNLNVTNLVFCKFPMFPQHFLMLVLGCTLFPAIYTVDQSMLFAHLYLKQGEKIEAWFLSPASREYLGVESTAFLSANKFTKKKHPLAR